MGKKLLSDEEMAQFEMKPTAPAAGAAPAKKFLSDEEMAAFEKKPSWRDQVNDLGQKAVLGLKEVGQKVAEEAPKLAREAVVGTREALPLMGSIAGGVLGSAVGPATGLAGATLGGVSGKGLQQLLETLPPQYGGLGKSPPTLQEQAVTLPVTAANSAAGEVGGQLIGGVGKLAAEGVGKALPYAAKTLGNLAPEAIQFMKESPQEFLDLMKNYAPKAYDLGLKARDALVKGRLADRQLVAEAKKGALQIGADLPVNVQNIGQDLSSFLEKNQPNSQGLGPLSLKEIASEQERLQKMYGSEPTAADLLKSKDWLRREIGNGYNQTHSDALTQQYKKESGLINQNVYGALENVYPELKAANQQFSLNEGERPLLKSLGTKQGAGRFVENYGQPSAAQEGVKRATKQLIPEMVPELERMAAVKGQMALENPGLNLNSLNLWKIARHVPGLASMGYGAYSHSPLFTAGGLALEGLTSPTLYRKALTQGPAAAQYLNPWVAPATRWLGQEATQE